jgi:hypothetical protein
MQDKLPSKVIHELCRYMGWPLGLYHPLIDTEASGGHLQLAYRTGKDRALGQCDHVNLVCDAKVCGVRTLYGGLKDSQQIPNDGAGARHRGGGQQGVGGLSCTHQLLEVRRQNEDLRQDVC